jgi:P-type E1-E2 ATPase
VLDSDTHTWTTKKWQFIEPGDIIQVECEKEVPADVLILNSSNKTGSVFVDTMNLDGETNLKELQAMNESLVGNEDAKSRLLNMKGEIVCESPNENLEKWEAQITYSKQLFKDKSANIKNLMLRGCFLRNTT